MNSFRYLFVSILKSFFCDLFKKITQIFNYIKIEIVYWLVFKLSYSSTIKLYDLIMPYLIIL